MAVLLWVCVGWAALGVLVAGIFAAVGRNALREDEALGYTGREPLAVPQDDADDEATSSASATA